MDEKSKNERQLNNSTGMTDEEQREKRWVDTWNEMLFTGLGEKFLRIGSVFVTLILLFTFAVVLKNYFIDQPLTRVEKIDYDTQQTAVVQQDAVLPYYNPSFPGNEMYKLSRGIFRFSQNHTDLPEKARSEVIEYTVQPDDTLIGIAEKYNISTSTLLWGNPYTLSDDPHALSVGMTLNILPVDGVYHEWHEGDGLNGVASVYKVTPDSIVDYPGNHLTRESVGDYSDPNIEPGTWLIIPGGSREFMNWSAPLITRENPAVASIYGPGACSEVYDGPLGSGSFIWPSSETWISGYDYDEASNHRAIDIAGSLGNPVYAADAGVVVYAGWNNMGYGNVVMIDHGNGFQTLYAHLDSYNVQCGYYVFSGDIIGGLGTTGNSSGPHLHYEIRYNGVPQNPHNFY